MHAINIYRVIKKTLCTCKLQYSTTDDLKMAIIEYILNVDRAILNTVFEHNSTCQYVSGDWRRTL